MALRFRAPRWAGQPSTFFLILNACLLTALVHYWTNGFYGPHASISVWVGEHDRARVEPESSASDCGICGPDDPICAKYG